MLLLAGIPYLFLLMRHISPSKTFHAAAAENYATRRRFSRICFQSVTNGLRRLRRGLRRPHDTSVQKATSDNKKVDAV